MKNHILCLMFGFNLIVYCRCSDSVLKNNENFLHTTDNVPQSNIIATQISDDIKINNTNDNKEQLQNQALKPLKSIFMGIYKNYRSTYLGNRTSSQYTKSLQELPSAVWPESKNNQTYQLTKKPQSTELKKKKKKQKINRHQQNQLIGSKKNEETLLYSYDGEYRYNLGPGVNITLDMNQDVVSVNLDEDCLKDIFIGKWTDKSLGRGRAKKHEMLTKILPLFILPFLIQSAIIPFLVAKLKLLLLKSILIGKLAIFLLIVSAIKNNQKSATYEPAPAYWASEPSRRSEIFGGYRVEGRPTNWVN